MWPEDIAETQQRYRTRWQQYQYDLRTLGWNKDCQWVRFEALFEGLRAEDFESILDVGCGFGDLLVFLRQRGWQGSYTGVDLVPELVDEARRQHSGDRLAEFECGDFHDLALTKRSDAAVSVGVFNHRLKQDNTEFVDSMIASMWAACTRVVVCDFLSNTADSDRRRPDLYYADPREIYTLASQYSRRLMIHHAYMPFEFQLKIWHDASFEVSAPVFEPYQRLVLGHTEFKNAADHQGGSGAT